MAGGNAMAAPAGGMTGSPTAAHKATLHREVAANIAEMTIRDPNPRNKAIFKVLELPISMSFNEETPLEDVLKYIRQATTSKTYAGIPIYADPYGLKDADVNMTSTVRNMDLDGIPLKTTLRLLLRQLDLAYCVHDGVLMISSYQGILDELSQAKAALEIKEEFGAGKDDPAEAAPSKTPGETPQEAGPPKAPAAIPREDAPPKEAARVPEEGAAVGSPARTPPPKAPTTEPD